MSRCWREERFDEIARGACADDDEKSHLAACEPCLDRFADARRDVELLAEVRASSARRNGNGEHGLVPGYRIESEIRRGGQGVVHRAIHEATRRVFALKVLSSTS